MTVTLVEMTFDTLVKVPLHGFVGMLALLVASRAAGWLLGGRSRDDRRALALTTSLRNIGVGLVIATGAFAGTEAVTPVLAYGVLEVVGPASGKESPGPNDGKNNPG